MYDDFSHNTIFHLGRYSFPKVKANYDATNKDKQIGAKVTGYTNRYYIADAKKNIEDIIKRWGEPYKAYPYTVAIARPEGIDMPYGHIPLLTMTIFSLETLWTSYRQTRKVSTDWTTATNKVALKIIIDSKKG